MRVLHSAFQVPGSPLPVQHHGDSPLLVHIGHLVLRVDGDAPLGLILNSVLDFLERLAQPR